MIFSEISAEQRTWQDLRAWYAGPGGARLAVAERELLAGILPDMFGYHLVQVGLPDEHDWLGGSRINHHILLDLAGAAETRAGLFAAADHLPVASESVDVVVLPHTLDFHPRPHAILREVDRVLIPEGHVIILGFNPVSLWGLSRVLMTWREQMPWRGQYYTQTRLRDWLALLGFDCTPRQGVFFRPPFANEKVMQKLMFMERFGQRYCPFISAVYALTARKRMSTLTPIRPRWRSQRKLVGVAEPTARNMHRDG
ncbi:MAG: methyltransferase domain-containing protein [Granulosicoccaceae bacterium]